MLHNNNNTNHLWDYNDNYNNSSSRWYSNYNNNYNDDNNNNSRSYLQVWHGRNNTYCWWRTIYGWKIPLDHGHELWIN